MRQFFNKDHHIITQVHIITKFTQSHTKFSTSSDQHKVHQVVLHTSSSQHKVHHPHIKFTTQELPSLGPLGLVVLPPLARKAFTIARGSSDSCPGGGTKGGGEGDICAIQLH